MFAIQRFLKDVFVRAPSEFFVSLLKIVFLVLLVIIIILLRIWEWLCKFLKTKSLYQEEKEEPCSRLPEAIIRRPDPCIYSQRLLQSQGIPVTWNNPDIWVARADDPTNIEPDSYHLVEDTDYIVSVQVHNASATDPAIGVRVRLNYRPWSFNSPDLTPVETDAVGNEVYRFVNVSPMSSAITQFNWHTPKLDSGQDSKHFCLQASLFHPMDNNTSNNMGQENTNVHNANPGIVNPGEEIEIIVPLFNFARQAQRFQFDANVYQIDDDKKFELQLKTTRGFARWFLSQRLANSLPNLHVKTTKNTKSVSPGFAIGRFDFQNQSRLKIVKAKYTGFEQIIDKILSEDYSLPPGMVIKVNGHDIQEEIELKPKELRDIQFKIKVPDDVKPETKLSLNLIAQSADDGVLAGGVTIVLDIREDK